MDKKTSIYNHQGRYWLQIYIELHILGGKIGISEHQRSIDYRYMSGFIIWIEKQLLAITGEDISRKDMFNFIF